MVKFYACLLTIVIEAVIIVLFHNRLSREKMIKLLLGSIPLNIVTNVTLNVILEQLVSLFFWQYLLLVILFELMVVVIETFALILIINQKGLAWKISLAMNLCSFVIGSLIYNLIL